MVMKLEKATIAGVYNSVLAASSICRLAQIVAEEVADNLPAQVKSHPGDLSDMARALALAITELSFVSEFMSDLESRAHRGEFTQ